MSDLDLGATIRGYIAGQKVFSRYTLKKMLGRGGMGVVWLARDEELEREVALKFLPEIVALDKESVSELKRETRRNLELTHAHIVRIYDFVEDAQCAAISMEFVDGQSLSALKAEQAQGVFALNELSGWLKQLCTALDFAHGKAKVVHRDLKPANLMIDRRGRLKITDFGIATSISESVSRVSRQAGTSGTPVYMSPQQMMGETPAATDDIYALGATLFELLTGKPPFYSGNVPMQVTNKVPPAMSVRRRELGVAGVEDIPAEWEETVAACLAKEPVGRPQSAREVAERLGLASAGAENAQRSTLNAQRSMTEERKHAAVGPALVAEPSRNAGDNRGSARSKTTRIAGMAAAIVIVGAGAIYFGTRDSGAGKPVAVVESAAAAKKDDGQTAAAAAAAKAADVARVEEARRAAREQVLARVSAMGTDADQVARGRLDEEVQQFLAKAAPADRTLVEERWNAVSQAWANARRPATVRVATIPEGAEVRVGEKMLRSPAVLQNLRPGKVRIEVSNAGFKSQTLELDLAPGERLEPPVIALAPITGKVQLMPARPGLRYRLQNPNGSAREGSLPALLELPVGRYPVHYMREGYGSREDTLVVAEAGPGEVTADVVGGSLHLSANLEGVEVSVNGRPVGTAPVEVKDLRPGEHEIEFSKSKFESVKRTRRLELGKELREAATLKPDAVTRFLQEMDGYWVTEWKLGEVRWGLRISAEDRLATMRVAGVFKPTDTKMVLRDFEAAKQRAMIAPGYHELELQGDLLIELSSSRDGLKEVRRYKRANEAEWNKI